MSNKTLYYVGRSDDIDPHNKYFGTDVKEADLDDDNSTFEGALLSTLEKSVNYHWIKDTRIGEEQVFIVTDAKTLESKKFDVTGRMEWELEECE